MPAVKVVTLFGSRASGRADADSDIDLQIITSRPAAFQTKEWLADVGKQVPVYALRPAFGRAVKATAILEGTQIDIVVLPLWRLTVAQWLVRIHLHRRSRHLRRLLADLSIVLRPGYAVVSGTDEWRRFFSTVVAEVPDPRLTDEEVVRLADCAFVDYLSVRRKIARGELLAAQRWLHVHLVDTNLKLLHEHVLRSGGATCHDGRRIEQLRSLSEQDLVRVNAHVTAEELLPAATSAIGATRALVQRLTGRPPEWSSS